MIQAKNINKTIGDNQILHDIQLKIKSQEIVSIVGKSGAGKTTLLQILGTLIKPDFQPTCELIIDGTAVHELSEKSLANFRNQNIGFIFQFHQLLPEFTAIENVLIPSIIAKSPQKEAKEYAQQLLADLGLADRMYHFPNQLSGGEQQRVAVARALINKPSVIFADEPSGNLDTQSAERLHELFFTLRKNYQQTFVIVTHNEQLASLSDRKIVMEDGRLVI